MDYSLLLAVHNITEEMKSTQNLSLLPPPPPSIVSPTPCKRTPSGSDITANSSLSIHEELRTTASTDSGITVTTVPNLPTYIQYIRVIEFIRNQQEPSVRTSSVSNVENSVTDNLDAASIKTVKPDGSPLLNTNVPAVYDHQPILRRNSKSPTNTHDTSPHHVTNALIGGDLWYNRQNLSRLAMYVINFLSLLM